ncbi:MAG TPA: hypothetical protein VFV39_07575, partial [Limnobacter sp.]|nr:hypothetical protein [Limnobacter sp.]
MRFPAFLAKLVPLAGEKTMHSKESSQRLCVCLTPLHVLIASRLSKSTGMRFDMGVYMAYQQD